MSRFLKDFDLSFTKDNKVLPDIKQTLKKI